MPAARRLQVIAKSESEMLAVAEALGRNFLFSGLPWEEKRVIIDAMERLKVAGGQVVVEQARRGGRGVAGAGGSVQSPCLSQCRATRSPTAASSLRQGGSRS